MRLARRPILSPVYGLRYVKRTDGAQMDGYELLDSGAESKLELYGDKRIARPSSVCIWTKRNPSQWEDADAVYLPQRGWQFSRRGKFESWQCAIEGVNLELRLQSNGQIGLFPEHAMYQSRLRDSIERLKKTGIARPRVLNLFAYTGLATVVAARAGCEVTHIDLSKKALTWARQNLDLNKIDSGVKLIPEDAMTFLGRVKKRGELPHIIIVDPPSFSRVSKDATWTIESVLGDLVEAVVSATDPTHGAILFTNHSSFFIHEIVKNLFLDSMANRNVAVTAEGLLVPEASSHRTMPAGSLVSAVWG